jgi:hypothetical protein
LNENSNGDHERPIWTLNRGLVVLRPKQPFVDWVVKLHRREEPPDTEWIRSTSSAFLIPEYELTDDSWEWIEENCSTFFALELIDWYTDEQLWPQDRSWKVFQEWFEIEFIYVVWDLVDETLSSEFPED